jgi:hypothetical protein
MIDSQGASSRFELQPLFTEGQASQCGCALVDMSNYWPDDPLVADAAVRVKPRGDVRTGCIQQTVVELKTSAIDVIATHSCCSSTQSGTPDQILDIQIPRERQGAKPWQAADVTFSF